MTSISFTTPGKEDILSKGHLMVVSPKGSEWRKSSLGEYADKRGVYIHHNGLEILYVGQTVKGKWGTFSERLRREFQETSSQNSRLYQFLSEKGKTGAIKTVCFSLSDVEKLVSGAPSGLSGENKALIFEQLLIGIFQPDGNRRGIFEKSEPVVAVTSDS